MHWEFIVALVIAVPLILFPAAYVWYMNIGGFVAYVNKVRAVRLVRKHAVKEKISIDEL